MSRYVPGTVKCFNVNGVDDCQNWNKKIQYIYVPKIHFLHPAATDHKVSSHEFHFGLRVWSVCVGWEEASGRGVQHALGPFCFYFRKWGKVYKYSRITTPRS